MSSSPVTYPAEPKEWFKVAASPELGRFLVASRPIPAGTIILQENPLVASAGDEQDESTVTLQRAGKSPNCLGCFKTKPVRCCARCGWPVCDDGCAEIPVHKDNECKWFEEYRIRFPLSWPVTNKAILVLRCHLVKSRSQDAWKELLKFEDHNEIRAGKKDCVKSDERVLRCFEQFYKKELTDEEKDEVRRLCGIINVNAFTSLKKLGSEPTISQCVYLTASLFSHSCIPNATWHISDPPELQMTIRTVIDIPAGEMITIPYSARENLAGTLQRLVSTEEVAHFQCRCERCRDPTELGTFLSALKCFTVDCKGYLLPLDPVNPESNWQCRDLKAQSEVGSNKFVCWSSWSVRQVVGVLYRAEEELEKLKRIIPKCSNDVQSEFNEWLNLLLELRSEWERSLLHRNHYLVQEISLMVVKYLCRNVKALTETELDCVIDCCERLLTVADVITPGLSPHRLMIRFHLAAASRARSNL